MIQNLSRFLINKISININIPRYNNIVVEYKLNEVLQRNSIFYIQKNYISKNTQRNTRQKQQHKQDVYKFNENGEYTQTAFTQSTLKDIHVRDQQSIDINETHRSCAMIQPRSDCIQISLDTVKAIIQWDKMYLLDCNRPIVTAFAETLRNNYKIMFDDIVTPNANDDDDTNNSNDNRNTNDANRNNTNNEENISINKKIKNTHNNEKNSVNYQNVLDPYKYSNIFDSTTKSLSSSSSSTSSSPTDDTITKISPKNIIYNNQLYWKNTLGFEFRVQEALLRTAIDVQKRRIQCFIPLINRLQQDMLFENQEAETAGRQLEQKSALSTFERYMEEINTMQLSLLHSNEDMLEMFLTEKHERNGELPPEEYHEECEQMLESFHREIGRQKLEAQVLRKKISSTEDQLVITMNSRRNKMIKVQTNTAILSASFSIGTQITGIFGMNLLNTQEPSYTAFLAFSGLSITIPIISVWLFHHEMTKLSHTKGQQLIAYSYNYKMYKRRDIGLLRTIIADMPDFQDTLLQYMLSIPSENAYIDREDLQAMMEDCADGTPVPKGAIDLLFQMYSDPSSPNILTSNNINAFVCDFPSSRWVGTA